MAKNLPEANLKIRMSSKDAHYAGNLVDGARILNLFGDLATELTIRYDGDEGLIRAYDNVEFLEPIYSGDFIELKAKITQVGQTSRKIVFEAYKIITPAKNDSFDSSCDVLETPILVARASGTCVVLQKKQRSNKK